MVEKVIYCALNGIGTFKLDEWVVSKDNRTRNESTIKFEIGINTEKLLHMRSPPSKAIFLFVDLNIKEYKKFVGIATNMCIEHNPMTLRNLYQFEFQLKEII